MRRTTKFFIVPILIALCAFQKQAKPKPNILWITCEDMSPHLGCYGEKVAQTPYLDALAQESVRYTHVFTTAGVCAPSRSALITGCYQTAIGTQHMRTLQVGRVSDSFPKDLVPYASVIPAPVKCFPEYLRMAGYYCSNNAKEDYQFEAPPTVWDESSGKAHWRNRAEKNQPFFSVFNLMVTHESQVWARNKEPLLVKPENVEVPPYYPDCPEVRLDIARHLSNVMAMDKQVGDILQQLRDDGLYDNTYVFFFSDHGDGLPFVKREISHRGLRVPMLIKAPKNDYSLKANTVDNQLISFIDLAPTVLSVAGISISKALQGQAFLGGQQAKVARQHVFAARDRMDTEYDRVRAVSDGRWQYVRHFMPEKPYYQPIKFRLSQPSMQAILTLKNTGKLNAIQMQWFRERKDTEELFDTQTDPHQLKNVANLPENAQPLATLRKEMDRWLKRYGDMGQQPEKEMLITWWGGSLENGPPVTQKPILSTKNNETVLSCPTEGASIAYKFRQQNAWQVYNGLALKPLGDTLYVLAQRIGYRPSERVVKKL